MPKQASDTDFLCSFDSATGKDSKAEAVPPCPVSLVPEEKVSFSLYALSVSALTVAKIRKAYNKLDSKAIAKQVNNLAVLYRVMCRISIKKKTPKINFPAVPPYKLHLLINNIKLVCQG